MIRRSGVKVAMLTGDRKETAVAIAKELNIFSANNLAVSDDELLRMSEEELAKQIDDITVFYDLEAEHKMKIIDAYKRRGY